MEFDIKNSYRTITAFNYMLQDDKLTQDERKNILNRINNIKENISKKEKELDKLKKEKKNEIRLEKILEKIIRTGQARSFEDQNK